MDILLTCHNYNELICILQNKTKKEKGDIFELLTKYIFLIHSEYKNKTKNIWLYNDIPNNIIKKFNLPIKDKGIDLLLQTKDGYYPIQCKFRKNVLANITWSDLSTFAGQIFVNNFKDAIYVTNTYSIDEEIKKCSKIKCIFGEFFNTNNLNELFFQNINNFVNKKNLIYIHKTPKYFQQNALDNSLEYFKNNDRGYLSMACGTGKTYTSFLIDYHMNTKLTLILVPSLYLLAQNYKEYMLEYCDKQVEFILCGSDIDDEYAKQPFLEIDENILNDKIKQITNKLIIISTYQSCNKLKLGLENKIIDLIIFDEAHKTVTDGLFSYALYNENLNANKRLFITATPKIYNNVDYYFGLDESDCESDNNSSLDSDCEDYDEEFECSDDENKSSDKEYEKDIICMNNKKIYGSCIFTYQIGQALDDNMLTQYEIHMMVITDEQIKQYINKNVMIDQVKYNFHYIASAMMIKQMIKDNNINHTLTYHSTIKNSEIFSELLTQNIENCNIDYINGNISSKKKYKLINEFQTKEKAILTSAKVLNEGVNIPIIDSVFFVEPRNSTIDIIQCIGRALRLYKGKTIAKIIIPILEEDIETSKFTQLIKIIKNLGQYDYHIKNFKNNTKSNLIRITNYCDDNTNKIYDTINLTELEGKIQSIIMIGCYKWEVMLEKLETYICINKKLPSQHSKQTEIKQLRSWLSRQNINYKKTQQIMNQDEIYNKWTLFKNKYKEYFLSNEELWNINLNKLEQYIIKNKKLPLKNSKQIEIKQLGNWISQQRINYTNQQYIMKQKYIYKKWTEFENKYQEYFSSNDDFWNNNLNKLEQYIIENKKLPSGSSKQTEIKQLGYWICTQNRNYKNKQYIMKQEEIYNTWTKFIHKYQEYFLSNDECWNINLNKLEQYIINNKKLPSIYSKQIELKLLGRWIYTQNKNYKKKKYIMKQEQIYNTWTEFIHKYQEYFLSNNECWNINLNKLEQYIIENKKLPSQQLGKWIMCQNKNYKKKQQIMKQEQIYNKWTELKNKYQEYFVSNEELWNNNLIKLEQYIIENKKLPPNSSKIVEIKQLGNWISRQNHNYKKYIYIMKQEEIYNKFTKFKNKYQEYFN